MLCQVRALHGGLSVARGVMVAIVRFAAEYSRVVCFYRKQTITVICLEVITQALFRSSDETWLLVTR